MTKIFFVADSFANEVLGGGELNNHELIILLKQAGKEVLAIKSEHCTPEFLKDQDGSDFIVGNFIALNPQSKKILENNFNYLIYEHDHKYLKTRDPSSFVDYMAPPEEIINKSFYEKASGVICQSKLHRSVVEKNLKLNNIHSASGNLWSLHALKNLEKHCDKKKTSKYSIWDSYNPIKRTHLAKAFCIKNNFEAEAIGNLPYDEFLDRITNNSHFVFFPETLETLGRVVVECRMAGMTVISNKKVGALSEEWFKMKGVPLIQEMRKRRGEIPAMVLRILDNQ